MRDKDLYAQILGVATTWSVTDVELDAKGEVVRVLVEHDPDVPLCCPSCGESSPGYDTRKRRWRHLDTCQFHALSGYGAALTLLNRAQEAEPLLRDAVQISQVVLPNDHPLARAARINLVDCLLELGQLDEAEQILEAIGRDGRDEREHEALLTQWRKLDSYRWQTP